MKKSILKGAMIIAFASLFSRFIGLFFRIPITSWLGDEGMGLYAFPMNFFLPIIAIVSVGPSGVISRMTSESIARKDSLETRKIFQSSMILMTSAGFVASILMLILAPVLVTYIWPREVLLPYLALVPAPFFLSIVAVFKGYYQGHQNMLPSAIQQITDGSARMVLGLLLTYYFVGESLELGTAAATFATSLGALFSLCVLAIIYFKDQNRHHHAKFERHEYTSTIKSILIIAVPIILGAIGTSLIPLTDSILINPRLAFAGLSESRILSLTGILSNVNALVNVPIAIGVAISLNFVPNIASARIAGESTNIRFRSAMIMMISLAIPSGLGILSIGNEIFDFIYDMPSAHYLMDLSSISIILTMINQGFIAALQGMGLEKLPVRNFYLGIIVKVIASLILLNKYFTIHGAVLSTIIAYSVITILNIKDIKQHTTFKVDLKYMIILPLINGSLMYIVVLLARNFLSFYLPPSLTIVLSIVTGGIVYGILLIVTKIIAPKDVPLLNRWFK